MTDIIVLLLSLVVKEIMFVGNKEISSKTLNSIIETRKGKELNYVTLAKDSSKMCKYLRENGYLDGEVSTLIKGDTLKFIIKEGKRSYTGEVEVKGANDWIINYFKELEKTPFITQKWEKKINEILVYFENNGYPHVKIKMDTTRIGDRLNVAISIQTGKRVYLRSIEFRGHRRINESFLRKVIPTKEGDIFSKKEIEKAIRALYYTRLFKFVDVRLQELESSNDSVDCVFLLQPRKYRNFSFGIGYEIPSGFLGSVGLIHRNLLERGISLSLGLKLSCDIYENYQILLESVNIYPKLTPLKFDLSLRPLLSLSKEEDIIYSQGGGELSTKFKFMEEMDFTVVSKYKETRFIRGTPEERELKEIINSIGATQVFDARNDIFNPSKGLYLLFTLSSAGGILKGDYDFYKFIFESRNYRRFIFNSVVAIRIRTGAIIPYKGTMDVPHYEKFTLGGANSLRGFSERSIGPDKFGRYKYGSYLKNFNFELRSPYFKNIGIVAFYDSGFLVNKIASFKEEIKMGIGFGFRYNSPLGPIRLDYGKDVKTSYKEDIGKVYLALLQAF